MEIIVKSFPRTHITSVCRKHECQVEVSIREIKSRNQQLMVGADITAMRCLKGGFASETDCMDAWELEILAGGEVRIGP